MPRIIGIFFCLLVCLACNRGQLIHVQNEMDENVEKAKWIRELQEQLRIDFQNARVFYEAMERKLYVQEVEYVDDGVILTYSDGSRLQLSSGRTSVVSFGTDGEVFINGQPTGYKPIDGEDGEQPSISVDADGYYVVNGVRTTLLQGTVGEDGTTPVVWIDDEGYYCVGNERVQPEICLKGQEGQTGIAPVPTIVMNEAVRKYELLIDGHSTEPPTFLSPQDGADGDSPASGGKYIQKITISNNNELIFTFNDGHQVKSSQIVLTDLIFRLDETDIYDLSIGQPYRIKYTVETDFESNSVTVNQMFALKGWQVLITPPDPGTGEGFITVTPVSGTSVSGSLKLMAMDSQQKTVEEEIKLHIRAYRIDIPAQRDSYVYDVFTPEGIKMAELAWEYIPELVREVWVAYPCNMDGSEYGLGYVVGEGGTVNHDGTFYSKGIAVNTNRIQFESGAFSPAVTATTVASVKPMFAVDVERNEYRVVKIGSQYWMQENLRVKRYKSGKRILPLAQVQYTSFGAYTFYEDNEAGYADQYGALYNGTAVQTGNLAPQGWHIPKPEEWEKMKGFLTVSKVGTGFMAESGGCWSGGAYSGKNIFFKWWTAAPGKYITGNSFTLEEGAALSDCYSIRCIKD